ncbi:MAG: UBP-type zinc finger domain-containing protein [Chloroflexi bacterium]|nr:UBP-type zinc finger domain-containing protein [Chloroflexota bacterium]
MSGTCQHLDQINQEATPTSPDQCPACVALGDEWVSLRMCCICGNVGCCDSSKNTHATGHFNETSHPVMKSHEPNQTWKWCYIEEISWD